MNVQEIIKQKELFFIDIETVGGIGICQIAITKWSLSEQRLCVVFNETINPDVPADKINIHAVRKHNISEYSWSKSKTYCSFHSRIKNLLDGKTVIHWGGSDISIIRKNIFRYNLEEININPQNSWSYHYKGVKLATAAETFGISYKGLHNASYDSFLTALLFVSDLCGYKSTNIDMKIIDSFNSRSSSQPERFKIDQLKTNGTGDEVCLTGFTSFEKKKFGELLAEKGFKIRGTVSSNLRILITPSGSYTRSPSKEAEAIRVGAEIMDLNSLLINLAMK